MMTVVDFDEMMPDRPIHDPDEVATLITTPASDRTGNVTGANCVIDGGLIRTT